MRAAFTRLDEIMDEPQDTAPGTTSPLPPIRGKIDFENVSFHFAEGQPPILDNVSLSIPQGSITGIVGPSGSGKSTLVKILQGLYAPDSGRVLIDDTDIAHMSLSAIRQQLGVVPQDVQLFAGTVRDNISIGMPIKDPMRVVAVARFVGAHDFIQRLPNGYDTVLGDRGSGLSSGQRQLIALARALIRNPRLIILDEATSALDLVSEDMAMRSLRRAAGDRTVVMVTHRTAPLAICDQVIFMMNGRVERSGTPAEIVPYARERMADDRRVQPQDSAPENSGAAVDKSGETA